MKRYLSVLLVSVLGLFILLPAVSYAKVKGRAISLKMLEETERNGGTEFSERLCGITRISGFIRDRSAKDVILVGKVDPNYPSIYLQDFVVALRNSRMMYAARKGKTYYYSSPGCSIDPDPRVLQELEQASSRFTSSRNPDEKQQRLEEWRAIGRQPQRVRVMGVPFDTHFAKVMVDADYYMKRLVDGSVALDIPGFRSLMDTRVALSKKEMEEGGDHAPYRSMNRFWFYPGDSTYTEDDGTYMLASCPVKLLTEEEFLTTGGEIKGRGRPDKLAQGFADSFTKHYQEIAEQRSIYKELETLFRFAAITQVMKDEKALESAGLRFLVERYQVYKMPVSRSVQGLTNLKEVVSEKETPEGTQTSYLWHMSCGGVSMDVKPRRIGAAPVRKSSRKSTQAMKSSSGPAVTTRTVSKPRVKKAVIESRRSTQSLYWDFETE